MLPRRRRCVPLESPLPTPKFASAISAYELTYVGQRIESDSFKSFEVYGTITLMYLVISSVLLVGFGWIRQRLFRYPVK